MPADQGPASDRDSLQPLSLQQLLPAYTEAIRSSDIQIAHVALRLLWRRLEEALPPEVAE
jgi:hypothetical protein